MCSFNGLFICVKNTEDSKLLVGRVISRGSVCGTSRDDLICNLFYHNDFTLVSLFV